MKKCHAWATRSGTTKGRNDGYELFLVRKLEGELRVQHWMRFGYGLSAVQVPGLRVGQSVNWFNPIDSACTRDRSDRTERPAHN